MQRILVLLVMLFSFCGFAQKFAQKADPPRPAAAAGGDLDTVLSQMDKAAQGFKSVQADFEWDQYTKVVNDTDVQKGQLYLQRKGNDLEAGVIITAPASKQIVFKDGKVQLLEPPPKDADGKVIVTFLSNGKEVDLAERGIDSAQCR